MLSSSQASSSPDYFRRAEACAGEDGCRSHRFYRADGLVYCKRGHEQPEGFQAELDLDGYETHLRQTTRLKKEAQEKVSQVHHGTPGLLIYLQAYQLVLWSQCHALISIVGLPAELETVVKDLWALRLQLLNNRVEPNDSDGVTEFGTQLSSEEDAETEDESADKMNGKAFPTLIESMALCYLAAAILRLPFSIGDLHRYAVREDIPLFRAVRLVPTSLKRKLPAEYLLALDTTSPLQPDHLRKSVHTMYRLYQHQFQVQIPTLNTPVLLYKHIRDLALPLPLYQAINRLATFLSIDFSFPKAQPRRRQKISDLPEMTLIGLLVMAVKLYHPFHTIDLCVDSHGDPALLRVDWDAWIVGLEDHQTRLQDRDHLARGSEINVTETDAMEMTGTQLDDYLDWYERSWVDEERTQNKSRGLPKQLIDMFSTGRQDGSQPETYDFRDETKKEHQSATIRLAETLSKMQIRTVITAEQQDDMHDRAKLIGSTYKRYRRIGDLTPHAKAFHEAVSKAVAVKLETLLVAVLQMERRLLVWREEQVRVERQNKTRASMQDMTSSSETSDA